jgi:ABC-type nitrate/sulfonate/bicarbonate transport system substrate-binding protein
MSGCNTLTPAASDSEGSAISKPAPVKVTLVLDWIVNTNHTGIYVASELGYFADEGLDVEIVQAPEMNFVEMVGMNSAQFGICGQEQLTQARVTGDVPVVAIGAILQHNTSGFAAPADRNIKTPKDFEGKKYSGWGTPLEERFIETLMNKSGGDFSAVEMRMMAATDYFAMMETEADFAWIYYGWDGIGAEVRNYPLDFILLQDVDPSLDFYSPLFITNEETIADRPELVQKFMKAVSQGYQYAVVNPEEACDLLLKSTPGTDRTHALRSIEYLSGYFLDGSGRFGTMEQTIWENFSAWMLDNKLIASPLDIEKSFTTSFLPE